MINIKLFTVMKRFIAQVKVDRLWKYRETKSTHSGNFF